MAGLKTTLAAAAVGYAVTMLFGATVASAKDFSCNGTLSGVIAGNVVVHSGADCMIDAATISGNVTAHLHDSTVGGNFQVSGLLEGLDVMDSVINGNVQIGNSTFGADPFTIMGNTVGGNLTFSNNTGPSDIESNVVGGNLQCENNSPPPTIAGNTAKEYEGAVRALAPSTKHDVAFRPKTARPAGVQF